MPKDETQTAACAPDWGLWSRMLPAIRKNIVAGVRNGRRWDAATTAGEIAAACATTPEHVVKMIDECGYLVAVNKDAGPAAQWTVYEDGE